MDQVCKQCQARVDEWNKTCGSCGFRLVLEPEEAIRERYLKAPSLGALLFTQGWTFGARLYIWFLISLVPGVGLLALFVCLFYGRRWSWKQGGWDSWEAFTDRMQLMDRIATAWFVGLLTAYVLARFR